MSEDNAPLVLVVDDSRVVRRIATQQLEAEGLLVAECATGDEALATASMVLPDLILLDMTMPGLSGVETCRRLKAAPEMAHVPVIFFSATTDLDRVVEALEAGATDFVSKPFQPAELLARVRAHVRVKRLQDDLRHANERLRDLERTRKDFVNMLTHDMRTLVNGIVGATSMIDEIGAATSDPLMADLVGMIKGNAEELGRMITSLLDLARMDAGQMPLEIARVDLVQLARDAIARARAAAMAAHVELILDAPMALDAEVDAHLIGRVLSNLLANAIKFSPERSAVCVTIHPTAHGGVAVSVADSGPGISEADQARLFSRFFQARHRDVRQKGGSGLGLAFCKRAVEMHGGTIKVESRVGSGSTFTFELPHRVGVPSPNGRPTTGPAVAAG